MSFVFELGDVTVWSPALSVGTSYVGSWRAAALALGLPDGLIDISSDMVDVDVPAFAALAAALVEVVVGSDHPVGRQLFEAVAGPAVVLLDRSGEPLAFDNPVAAAWASDRRALAASMPM